MNSSVNKIHYNLSNKFFIDIFIYIYQISSSMILFIFFLINQSKTDYI